MKVRLISLYCAGALMLALCLWAWQGLVPAAFSGQSSQGSGQGQPQQPPKTNPPSGQQPPAAAGQAPPAAPAEVPKGNPEEEAAYKAFYELKTSDGDQIVLQGEDFLKKYPESHYRVSVYSRLTIAYFTKNDTDKMFAAGEKAIELNPDDVDVLSLLGWVIPHSYNPNELDAEQKLTKAEQYSKHAIEVLAALPKPAGMTDEAFAESKTVELSRGHSGLGLVYFRRSRFEESVAEMQQAAQAGGPPDPVNFYVMGIDLQQLKRFGDAAAAFDKCAQIAGPLQDPCKQSMEASKKQAASQPATPKP